MGASRQEYIVQTHVQGTWQNEQTYQVFERRDAILTARRLNRDEIKLPIRVIFDNYNSVSDLHTRAVVYRNNVAERDGMQKKVRSEEPKKQRVRLLGYMAIQVGVVLSGMMAGILLATFGEIVLREMQFGLDQDMRGHIRLGSFIVAFVVAAHSAYQYFMTRYEFYMPGYKKRWWPLWSPRQARNQPGEKTNKLSPIARQMKKAAQDIDRQPHRDYREEVPVVTLGTMRLHGGSRPETEAGAAPPKPPLHKIRLFLSTLLSDILSLTQRMSLSEKVDTELGLRLVMVGGVEQLTQIYQLSDEENTKLSCEVLGLLGLRGQDAMQFLLDYEHFDEHPVHHRLIESAKQITQWVDGGQSEQIVQLPDFMLAWQEALACEGVELVCQADAQDEQACGLMDSWMQTRQQKATQKGPGNWGLICTTPQEAFNLSADLVARMEEQAAVSCFMRMYSPQMSPISVPTGLSHENGVFVSSLIQRLYSIDPAYRFKALADKQEDTQQKPKVFWYQLFKQEVAPKSESEQ